MINEETKPDSSSLDKDVEAFFTATVHSQMAIIGGIQERLKKSIDGGSDGGNIEEIPGLTESLKTNVDTLIQSICAAYSTRTVNAQQQISSSARSSIEDVLRRKMGL